MTRSTFRSTKSTGYVRITIPSDVLARPDVLAAVKVLMQTLGKTPAKKQRGVRA